MQFLTAPVDVRAWIDAQQFSRFQWLVVFLSFCVVAVDGLDTACVGFIAPALRQAWQIGPSVLGALFAAGLAGLMVGAFAFGPVADRIGRKKTLLACVAFFGVASLASALSPTIVVLIVLRFVTGLGLGGAMPNAIALTSEYCPQRRKSFLTTVMFCGFTLGSGLGGVLAAHLVPLYGWRAVLVAGGVLPLALAPVLALLLPESVGFLVARNARPAAIRALLSRIVQHDFGDDTSFILSETRPAGSPVRQLFAAGFRVGTLLLWCVFFMSLLIVYLMTNWLPTIAHNANMTLADVSRLMMLYQVGGTVGALVIGRAMDRLPPTRVLSAAYGAGAFFIAAVGVANGSLLMLAVAGVGFCISGSQIGANAYAAQFYPTGSRVTGISWALGIGRLGSIVGSMLGGVLLAMNISQTSLFVIFAIPAALASIAAFHCRRGHERHAAQTTQSAQA
ncbi:aromatic acid/H+ symport family MFS transporter [Trinickia terrae]|uniref:Aromatic acid/H+ symport family MFS transporter n=1 Tax=Trinickia terrae TaxID=2571161 RepID=A0A4U1I3V4_9BURK|nr:aromatic acid/H+ symport family MFS transporter [Trinickia terrae]TKC87928.1 aromatic acid/H+ symport family MFS transporter [Trinickia terrae]